jgi:hypothetical protein
MQKIIFTILFTACSIFVSCKKDTPANTIFTPPPPPSTNNKPPVAVGSPFLQIITLPNNSAPLNGSGSYDSDGTIVSYLWAKVSGPAQYNLINPNQAIASVNNLEAGTYSFRLTVVDDKGASSNDTIMVTVEKPVPACTMQLTPFGNLSIARSEVVTAAAGNKILFAGGYVFDNSILNGINDIPQTRVDIYDKVSQTWSTAELSQARFGMAVAVLGNKIFFAGGFYFNSVNTIEYSSLRIDIYDAATNTWSTAELSKGRYSIAAVAAGNKVVFAGGVADDYFQDIVDIYDVSTNTWSAGRLSEPKGYPSATSLNNKIYIAGASDYFHNQNNSNKVDIYDVSTSSWSATIMSEPAWNMASIAAGNTIFWAGGQRPYPNKSSYSDKVEMYDVISGNRTYHQLSRARGDFKAVIKQNEILFYSGDPRSVDIYNVAAQTWSTCSIPLDLYPSFISAGDKVYVAGGIVNGVLSTQVWLLDF